MCVIPASRIHLRIRHTANLTPRNHPFQWLISTLPSQVTQSLAALGVEHQPFPKSGWTKSMQRISSFQPQFSSALNRCSSLAYTQDISCPRLSLLSLANGSVFFSSQLSIFGLEMCLGTLALCLEVCYLHDSFTDLSVQWQGQVELHMKWIAHGCCRFLDTAHELPCFTHQCHPVLHFFNFLHHPDCSFFCSLLILLLWLKSCFLLTLFFNLGPFRTALPKQAYVIDADSCLFLNRIFYNWSSEP